MLRSKCVGGCNDLCSGCELEFKSEIRAGSDTLTPEQETFMRHEGASFGNSGILAAKEGFYVDI